METVHSINWIRSNPTVRGGSPCLVGTGLRVIDVIMAHLFHTRTPSELATDYGITLAQVYAIFSYYYDHKSELDADIRQQIMQDEQLAEQSLGIKTTSILS
ncbi:MAG: DUF433 domain-containing protein [Phototrophicaceae bacterium]|jgi:uncharacterized protein (DUF433 family)